MNKVLITGSAGHLGEALAWTLSQLNIPFVGIDIKPSRYTTLVASVTDRFELDQVMVGVDTVFHTATLHKPHVKTHSTFDFIESNISGTQTLLDAAVAANVRRFIFTSTTSVFGDAMRAVANAPAIWVDETLVPDSKNIYGVTKLAAEDLCRLAFKEKGLNCLILRTSRFFPEDDDSASIRSRFTSDNSKVNEFLNRRAELSDVVAAHLCAARKADEIGFGLFIISATSPFTHADLGALNSNMSVVVKKYYPDFPDIYANMGWSMFERIDRVYDNSRARLILDWQPEFDFRVMLDSLRLNKKLYTSAVTEFVGVKGYHDDVFEDGPFPV